MPWCETCAKFWNPSSMPADGSCPTCGRSLAVAPKPAAGGPEPAAGEGTTAEGTTGEAPATLTGAELREMAGENAKAPWHFKLMVLALVLYLGWRAVQLVLLIFR